MSCCLYYRLTLCIDYSILLRIYNYFLNPASACDLRFKVICRSRENPGTDSFSMYLKSYDYSIPEQIAQIMRTGDFAMIYDSDEARIGKYPFADFPFLAVRIRDGNQNLGLPFYHSDF